MTAPPLAALQWVLCAILVAASTHLYLWRRLFIPSITTDRARSLARAALRVGGALLPIGMIELLFMRHMPRDIAAPLMWITFTWVGVAYFLFIATLALEPLRLLLRPSPSLLRRLTRGFMACALAVSAYAMAQGLRSPNIVKTSFVAPAALDGYRIVQLSDLHVGPTIGVSFVRSVVSEVNAQHPDLIVISGDLVDGSVATLTTEVAPLSDLHATDGVVVVIGNHEYLSGADAWVAHFQSMGLRVLRNAHLTLPRLEVIGTDDQDGPEFDPTAGPNFDRATLGLVQGHPTLLVAHEPLSFADGCRAHVNFALAGHTHGGQIAPLGFLAERDQGYLRGAYSCGATQLYVSSGTGYWGPPMRLGSRAEITLIELKKQANVTGGS